MVEIFQIIFRNEIMYYVIVPISILILGWMKNWYEVKSKNKKMGYWKIKVRREHSFNIIIMKTYILMMINLIIIYIIKGINSFWIEDKIPYTIIAIFYITNNTLIILHTIKRPKIKIELWTDGRTKQLLLGALWLIYNLTFFSDAIPKYKHIITLANSIALIGWYVALSKYTDIILILDKSYADIYANGIEPVKYIYAGSMRKKGGWIYVNRNVDGYEEEIRIKENEIIRIDCYGEPIIYIPKKGK